MSDFVCPRCGNACGYTFARYIVKNGKTIYPKKAKAFRIPQCECAHKKAA